MNNINILWVDDEIDLLKPHIIFLEQKNYNVTTCNSGTEALEILNEKNFDIVFLDENMPGLTGLETLNEIKEIKDTIPVVMITKSEEEYIMEEAIGNKIADYLIKPVNPNQILLSLKKNLDHSRLVSEKTTSNYQQEFRKIAIYFTCLLLINCAGSAQHDVVSAHKAGDMDMTCKELDSEIVRAQVIIDGVEKDKSGMSGADILDGLLWFPFNLIAKSQNYKNSLNFIIHIINKY